MSLRSLNPRLTGSKDSLGPLSQPEIVVGKPLSRATGSIVVRPLRNQIHRLVQNVVLHLARFVVHGPWLLAIAVEQLTPGGGYTAAGEEKEKGYDPHPHLVLGCMKNSQDLMVLITFQEGCSLWQKTPHSFNKSFIGEQSPPKPHALTLFTFYGVWN